MLGGRLPLPAGGLAGNQHHGHVAALQFGEHLHPTDVGHRLGDLVEDAAPQLGVLHLSAAEHDRDLDLAAVAQERFHLAGLGGEVTGTDLRPVLHLLDQNVGRLPARFLGPLGLFVLELPVVHDPADRWIGLVGHLH